MIEIPMEIKDDVNKIIDYLLKYKDDDTMSWTGVYKKTLKELKLEDKINDNLLLSSTVRELTNLGYDIIGEPFKLEKFK